MKQPGTPNHTIRLVVGVLDKLNYLAVTDYSIQKHISINVLNFFTTVFIPKNNLIPSAHYRCKTVADNRR